MSAFGTNVAFNTNKMAGDAFNLTITASQTALSQNIQTSLVLNNHGNTKTCSVPFRIDDRCSFKYYTCKVPKMPFWIYKTANHQNLANTTVAQLSDIFAAPAGCPTKDLNIYTPKMTPEFYLAYSSSRGIYHINQEAYN